MFCTHACIDYVACCQSVTDMRKHYRIASYFGSSIFDWCHGSVCYILFHSLIGTKSTMKYASLAREGSELTCTKNKYWKCENRWPPKGSRDDERPIQCVTHHLLRFILCLRALDQCAPQATETKHFHPADYDGMGVSIIPYFLFQKANSNTT
jgi:hypothetical protein